MDELDKEIANMMGIGSSNSKPKPAVASGSTVYTRPEPIVETILVKLTITTYPNGQKYIATTAWNPEAKFKTYTKPKKSVKVEVKQVNIGQEEIL
jgi:hypothetical protein